MIHAPARTFLFLQGLASDFFNRLGGALSQRGHRVVRINFNAGDRLFWRQPGAMDYRGRPEHWPAFVTRVMEQEGVTDIVLFGDCRPMHRTAIEAASTLFVTVHVVEEGYIRPDWVTIEQGGVNGHSTLPRDPEWYRAAARTLPPVPEIAPIRSSFRRRAWEDIAYNLCSQAFAWAYPHYRTHRPWHIAVEYVGWIGRLARRRAAQARSSQALQSLERDHDYYLFPLQLDCDSQVRLHSSFSGMRAAIQAVFRSFALSAPPHARLVVKEHPLDNGLVNWRRFALAEAERFGIADRLIYLEQGDIALLVRDAKGVVTVNSTTGTLALASGVPVITLGSAIYDLQGLTFQGELDAFWHAPPAPDAALFEALRRVLYSRCLVRGGFFSEDGLALLVAGTIVRLEAATPARRSFAEPAEPRIRYRVGPLAAPISPEA